MHKLMEPHAHSLNSPTGTPNWRHWLGLIGSACVLLMAAACSSGPEKVVGSTNGPYRVTTILPGDVIQISFPGATNLNTTAQVPLDGDIRMAFGDSVNADGLTPSEMETVILEKFGPQLVLKEVDVTVLQSVAVIYVSGAVLQPTKIPMNRPYTLLEAIMEAGGPNFARAKLSEVKVIRDFQGDRQMYTIDFSEVLSGKNNEPFYLRPFDVVTVPERRFNF